MHNLHNRALEEEIFSAQLHCMAEAKETFSSNFNMHFIDQLKSHFQKFLKEVMLQLRHTNIVGIILTMIS